MHVHSIVMRAADSSMDLPDWRVFMRLSFTLIIKAVLVILILFNNQVLAQEDNNANDSNSAARINELIAASAIGATETVDELLSSGIDINRALLLAEIKEDTKLVKLLLKHGADPNYQLEKNPLLVLEIINRAN